MPATRPLPLTAAVCAALVLAMLGNATFPALIPLFRAEWSLSATEAGWLSGVYYAGYAAAVPLLVGRTDRTDARAIFVGATLVGAVAALGFALFARDVWTALPWRLLAGAALAGCFMVGARILADRIPDGAAQSRAIAWYTAHFSIGIGLSTLAAGELAALFGWQAAFHAAALGSLAAAGLLAAAVRPRRPEGAGRPGGLPWRRALADRPAMSYVLAYACHVWELFGWRAWLVAFLAAAPALSGMGAAETTRLATLALLVGLPASVLGNELAIRFGRRRVLAAILPASAALTLALGLAVAAPAWLLLALLFAAAVMVLADSGALTAGAVGAAAPEWRGALMAVHTLAGFGAGFVAPLAVGIALDAGGGAEVSAAWGWGFAVLSAGALLGPLALAWGAPRR